MQLWLYLNYWCSLVNERTAALPGTAVDLYEQCHLSTRYQGTTFEGEVRPEADVVQAALRGSMWVEVDFCDFAVLLLWQGVDLEAQRERAYGGVRT